MESIRPSPAPNRSMISRAFRKVIRLKTSPENPNTMKPERESSEVESMEDTRNRAFLAKLFAGVSTIKAAYADLQAAQIPYDDGAVQTADQAVVDELKSLSELKRGFLKNETDHAPPHVTLMLAEIQEQQALMRIYETTTRKTREEMEARGKKVISLSKELEGIVQGNRSMERKMNASGPGPVSVLDRVGFSDSNPTDFVMVLNHALRSVRSFVKLFIREMESANWDIDRAAASAVSSGERNVQTFFAFQSFVCGVIFDGFNDDRKVTDRSFFFEEFKNLRSSSSAEFLRRNPSSSFGDFLRAKYLRFVHPKMEISFSGNLNQRKTVTSGGWPETEFFKTFAEMCRRVWLLRCLAYSFDHEVLIFRAEENSGFTEVYMESVSAGDDGNLAVGEVRVDFTVVPGFKFPGTVVQTQVYLFPGELSGRRKGCFFPGNSGVRR